MLLAAVPGASPVTSYITLIPYMLFVVGMIVVLMLAPRLIATYSRSATKDMPYECGVDPIGSARQRFSVHFYLVAVLFILFDIEAVFLFPWALALRDLPAAAFVQAVVFVGILGLGLGYAWRKGVLDWR